MSAQLKSTSPEAYSGYRQRNIPAEDPEITHTDPGTPMGELMRRYWQPVCLAAELTDVPLALRILGEDLVAFRDKRGRVGVLHLHCCHRGSSLEYGIICEQGIRCCYHGWHFDIDGTILQAGAEPPGNPIQKSVTQGAYPAREYRGLVFAYLGEPGALPDFPVLDTYERPGNELVPYSVHYDCNWLQVMDNFVDPAHAYWLHSTISTVQFSDAWAQQPTYDWVETPDGQGMYYITVRRVENRVWIRSNHIWLPNVGQVGALLEKAESEKFFNRASITRWTVPIDDTHSWIFGWRHFNDDVDPFREGKREECGRDSVDFVGQTSHRPYAERQRVPGDWDAQTSQRPIAVHALEHLGSTDIGVAMWRRLCRKAARGDISGKSQQARPDGRPIHTFTHDTVLVIEPAPAQDNAWLKRIGREVLNAILEAESVPDAERAQRVWSNLLAVKARYTQ